MKRWKNMAVAADDVMRAWTLASAALRLRRNEPQLTSAPRARWCAPVDLRRNSSWRGPLHRSARIDSASEPSLAPPPVSFFADGAGLGRALLSTT